MSATTASAALPPLDHVVITVSDLARATADYRAAGFTVAPGGVHPGRHTRNALVLFQDGSYLELIAFDQPTEDRWHQVLARHGEGLVDYALLPTDVAARVREARARGLAGIGDPQPGGRLRQDGVEVAWQIVRQASHDLPFYCADVTPRHLRVPEGDLRQHANGALGVAEIRVACNDPARTLARYRAFLGDEAIAAPDLVQLPGTRIRLLPRSAGARDEGPCGITLAFAQARSGVQVPPQLAHRVAFEA
ncbi:VOC family protein [Ramlibacter sp. AN1015]|uniref:VOC family protein n=1 Tax=Ramlibacter sp. AN1015 TaxID=3133428 RepID=UPI0030C51095